MKIKLGRFTKDTMMVWNATIKKKSLYIRVDTFYSTISNGNVYATLCIIKDFQKEDAWFEEKKSPSK